MYFKFKFATISNGVANIKLTPHSGYHSYTVAYSGNDYYESSQKTITINVESTTKTLSFTDFGDDGIGVSSMLNEHDKIWVLYEKGYSGQYGKRNVVDVSASIDEGFIYAKVISAKVYYKEGNIYGSKNIPLSTQIYEGRYYPSGYTTLNDNQTPYEIEVIYIPYYYN